MYRFLAVAALTVIGVASMAQTRPGNAPGPSFRDERHTALITSRGRTDHVEVYGFSHEVESPRDAASGLPTGKRQHKPFTIIKRVDETSGPLLGAMLRAEPLADVTVTSFRRSRGRWIPYRVIRLEEVYVNWVGQRPDPPNEKGEPRTVEEVAFYYNKIKWSYEGGVEHEDTWREQN